MWPSHRTKTVRPFLLHVFSSSPTLGRPIRKGRRRRESRGCREFLEQEQEQGQREGQHANKSIFAARFSNVGSVALLISSVLVSCLLSLMASRSKVFVRRIKRLVFPPRPPVFLFFLFNLLKPYFAAMPSACWHEWSVPPPYTAPPSSTACPSPTPPRPDRLHRRAPSRWRCHR